MYSGICLIRYSLTVARTVLAFTRFPIRGCSKSPIKMTHRISDVMLFRSSRIKCIRSGTGSYAASNFSVLFILLFEHALLSIYTNYIDCIQICSEYYHIIKKSNFILLLRYFKTESSPNVQLTFN